MNEEVLYLQPLIPPKRFDIFPPITGGCSEGLGVFCFFFKIPINLTYTKILVTLRLEKSLAFILLDDLTNSNVFRNSYTE